MNKIFLFGAIMLLVSCENQHFPTVVNMPYCDANTTVPAVELTQVERTDSTTELTFMAMYDYYYITFTLGDDIELVSGESKLPLQRIESIGNALIKKNYVVMPKGVPVQFKMIFPALPKDAETVDFIQTENGKIINSIWGIDLTSKRSPNDLPAEIPAKLLEPGPTDGPLPQIVRKDGIAKITAHVVAWRKWMNDSVKFVVNTIDDTQEIIKSKFDHKGVVTVEIPLKGTANISVKTSHNYYSDFYVDPDEDINVYILPINNSETQRFTRPQTVMDGKYRNFEAMYNKLLLMLLYDYSDSLLLNKTDPDEYFSAMMKIHSNYLDSIKARNFDPEMEKYARSYADRHLMDQAVRPDGYTTRNMDERDAAKADSVLRFSPDQIRQIRSSIDFDNPLLEVKSIRYNGSRSYFLNAKKLILAE